VHCEAAACGNGAPYSVIDVNAGAMDSTVDVSAPEDASVE
jgi:hypothetical protein